MREGKSTKDPPLANQTDTEKHAYLDGLRFLRFYDKAKMEDDNKL